MPKTWLEDKAFYANEGYVVLHSRLKPPNAAGGGRRVPQRWMARTRAAAVTSTDAIFKVAKASGVDYGTQNRRFVTVSSTDYIIRVIEELVQPIIGTQFILARWVVRSLIAYAH